MTFIPAREQEASAVTCGNPGVSISVILADVFLPIKAQRNQKHNEKEVCCKSKEWIQTKQY